MVRKALGKGLSALVSTTEAEQKELVELAVEQIVPNRYQPRSRFDEEALRELAASIKTEGLMQPIVVRRGEKGYELVAGERRWRAARLAGLDRVPAIVREVEDRDLLRLSLLENLQREDLNPMEEAEAYDTLIREIGFSQDQVAEVLKRDRSSIANTLRLKRLPEEIKNGLRKGLISRGHGLAIVALPSDGERRELYRQILRRGLSVREVEAAVRKGLRGTRPRKRKQVIETALEKRLREVFGTKVVVRRRGKRGKIEIEFYSQEDLERILEVIGVRANAIPEKAKKTD